MNDTECALVKDVTAKVLKMLDVRNYDIKVSIGAEKGDNYLGTIWMATVTRNGLPPLHFIVKVAQLDENARDFMPIVDIYAAEVHMYRKVFPAFDDVQNQKCLSRPFTAIPRCYGTFLDHKKEAIVLENLKPLGYKLWDRQKPMNEQHLTLVFKEYARFHALSIALRDQKPKQYEDLTQGMDRVWKAFFTNESLVKLGITNIDIVKNIMIEEGNLLAGDKIERLKTDDTLWFQDPKECGSVILHGDCWCNNFLFKYEDTENLKPVDLCILDFQLSVVGNLVRDLSYFLYTCGPRSSFDNLDLYLDLYYKTMVSFLGELGTNVPFSFEQLKDQWKQHAKQGALSTFGALKLMLTEKDEVNSAQTQESFDKAINGTIKNEEEYRKRIVDVVEHLINNGFL